MCRSDRWGPGVLWFCLGYDGAYLPRSWRGSELGTPVECWYGGLLSDFLDYCLLFLCKLSALILGPSFDCYEFICFYISPFQMQLQDFKLQGLLGYVTYPWLYSEGRKSVLQPLSTAWVYITQKQKMQFCVICGAELLHVKQKSQKFPRVRKCCALCSLSLLSSRLNDLPYYSSSEGSWATGLALYAPRLFWLWRVSIEPRCSWYSWYIRPC